MEKERKKLVYIAVMTGECIESLKGEKQWEENVINYEVMEWEN